MRSTWIVGAAALAIAIACDGGSSAGAQPARPAPAPGSKPTTANKPSKQMTPLSLTWSMKVDGARLRIDYTVTNTSKQPVLIVDQLMWDGAPNPDVIIVRNDTRPQTIAFTRAHLPTAEKLLHTHVPTGRSLAPGAALTGHSLSAWPPFAWHNFSTVDPLAPDATHAILELGYIDRPDATLQTVPTKQGTVTTLSHLGSQKLVRSDALPLPAR